MNKYAHVENGIVTNISLWDGVCEYNPGENVTMVFADDNARIGGAYDGSFHCIVSHYLYSHITTNPGAPVVGVGEALPCFHPPPPAP